MGAAGQSSFLRPEEVGAEQICRAAIDCDLIFTPAVGQNAGVGGIGFGDGLQDGRDAFPEKNIPAKSAAGVAAHGAEEADLSPKPGGGDSLVIGFATGFDENAFRAKRLAGGVKMVCGEKYGFAAKADGTDPCCFRLHNRHLTGIGCGGKSGR